LRRAPEVHFQFDESIGHQDRVEQLLNEIADERAKAPVLPDASTVVPEGAIDEPESDDR